MAFKRVIIRRVGPLSWLLAPMSKYIAAFLLLASTSLGAQQFDNQIRFTKQASSLGASGRDEVGDVSFTGYITISGLLRVEVLGSDKLPEACGEACAYIVPDASSQKKLPRLILNNGVTSIKSINLYNAKPILNRVIGARRTKAVLADKPRVYEIPVTIKLAKLKIYGACSGVHYEAVVSSVVNNGQFAATDEKASISGC